MSFKNKNFQVIEESRFLNVDDYGRIQGGGTDHCKDGTALYNVCGDKDSLHPLPCLYDKPCEGDNYVVCGVGNLYNWKS